MSNKPKGHSALYKAVRSNKRAKDAETLGVFGGKHSRTLKKRNKVATSRSKKVFLTEKPNKYVKPAIAGAGVAAAGFGAKKLYDKAKERNLEKKAAQKESRGKTIADNAKGGAKIGAAVKGTLGAAGGYALGSLAGQRGKFVAKGALGGVASGAVQGGAIGALVGSVRTRKDKKKEK